MNVAIPYYFFRLFEKDRTSFIYQGEFGDDLITKTIRLGEYSIRKDIAYNRMKKKVSFLISECLQNAIRYEEKPQIIHQTNNRPCTFMVRNIGNSYYVISSNRIKNENVDSLKVKLKTINELGQEAVDKQGAISLNPSDQGKTATGLGLIEMTKKSGQKLEYDFEFINSYLSCFYLQVKLSAAKETNKILNVSMANTREVFNDILKKDVMLLYKGDCSQQSMLPVLSMIETNLKKDSKQYNTRKKMFYLLVEVLQNMSKHAVEKNGIRQGVLIICKKNQNYYIYSGNLIAASKEEEFKNYLKRINSMDKVQLASLYKEHLLDGKVRSKGGAGLGLIDMARYSTEKPVFDFQKFDAESSFYSFGLSL